jgi:hypothetical protein
MTVIHIGNSVYRGLSTDTKPTTQVATNAAFFETDTGKWFDYTGTVWRGRTANVGDYDFFIFIDTTDSNKIKAFNGATGRIDFSHATDFGNVFNSCVTALGATGGKIEIDSGEFLTTTSCIFKNFITVIGQGMNTIIKLANGVNGGTHVMATPNVDSMAGTNDANGVNVIHGVRIKDFVIDGNKANNATAGCGLNKYGYNWVMTNIQIHHTKSHGIMSEWGSFGGAHAEVGGVAMSDHNSLLHVWRPDGKGIYWRGPHDSQFDNCIVYGAGLENWHIQSGTGFSGGSSLSQCHTYTAGMLTPSDSMFIDNSFCSAVSLSLEGAHDTGKAALHLTDSAKMVGTNIWCFASEIGMLIESDFNNIQGYISGVEGIGCSVQTDHNNLDINIVDMVTAGGFGLVVGASGNPVSYNRIRARTSKINDTHLSWDNASNADNSLELISVVDTGETDCTTLANINQVTNNFKAFSIGPGTKNLTTANPALIPFTNVVNTFTEPPVIRKDAADLLTLQRSNNGVLGTGIAFNLGTSGTGNQYAKIYGFAVTASPLVGRLEFWLPNNSSNAKRLALLADGALETQSYLDLTKISAPADPGAELGRLYFKQIDANNNGLFVKLKQAGSIVEVQIAP